MSIPSALNDEYPFAVRHKEFQRFLKAVTKYDVMHHPDPIIYFQPYKEKKHSDLPKQNYFAAPLSANAHVFKILNEHNQQGYSCHFACQEFGSEGDPGDGRKRVNVSRVRCLYFDVDTFLTAVTIDKLIEFFKPSLVVASSRFAPEKNSKPKYKTHFYFLIKSTAVHAGDRARAGMLDKFENGLLRDFETFQRLLAFRAEEFLCAESKKLSEIRYPESGIISKDLVDKNCTGTQATLRLPGFFHCKEPGQEFLTRLIYKNSERFISNENYKSWMKEDLGMNQEFMAWYESALKAWKKEVVIRAELDRAAKAGEEPRKEVKIRAISSKQDQTISRYAGASEGARNVLMHQYCSSLFYNRHFSFNEALGACNVEDQLRNSPPLGEEEIESLVKSCWKEWRKSLSKEFLNRLKRGDSFAVKDLVKQTIGKVLTAEKEALESKGGGSEGSSNGFHYDYSNPVDFASLLSDVAVTERLIQKNAGEIGVADSGILCGYQPESGLWDNSDEGNVFSRMRSTFYDVVNEPAVIAQYFDEKGKLNEKSYSVFVKNMFSAQTHTEVARMLRTTPRIKIPQEEFNKDEHLIHCKNGVVDLETGKLHPFNSAYNMTMSTGLVYETDGSSLEELKDLHSRSAWYKYNLWTRFLIQIMEGDVDMCRYIQKIFGYILRGRNPEELMFFLYGLGSNGKSTVIETALKMLGEYAFVVPASLFMADSRENKATIIAQLPGKRLIATSEVGQNKSWDEETIKNMSGVDSINARQHREKSFNFRPVFKTFVRGNHKPIIRGSDLGIWRRIRLIPFSYTIDDKTRDVYFGDKLRAILPEIFLWSVAGHQMYLDSGLTQPKVAYDASREYKAEMNPIPTFMSDCFDKCSVKRGSTIEEISAVWNTWRHTCSEPHYNPQTLGKKLSENNFKSEVVYIGKKNTRLYPYTLKDEWKEQVKENEKQKVVSLFSNPR